MNRAVAGRLSAATTPAARAAKPAASFVPGEPVSIDLTHLLAYPPHTRGKVGFIAGPPRRVRLEVLWPVRFGISARFVEVRAGHLRKERAA